MPAEQQYVESIDTLEGIVSGALTAHRRVSAFMVGSTDPKTGDSWCPDCREAEPIVESCLKKTQDTDLFLMIEVGDRSEWKDPNNPFRQHPVYQLKEIPTLILFTLGDGGGIAVKSKLEGDGCKDPALVDKLLAGG